MNLRSYAAGKPCLIHAPVCIGGTQTTVLCHLRMQGISGMGIKASDIIACWGCSECHAWCDTHGDEGRVLLLKAVIRTQAVLIDEGVIIVKGQRERKYKPPSKIVPRRVA